MADGALGSDHVNYLVLRYLQENGHETAAKAFYRDWYRADEYSDPENYPFASVVKQHELVNIIQDGLFHDQLQATVTHGDRRFNLTSPSHSRPGSSHRIPPKPASRRPSAYVLPEQDEFPTPAPKRVRRSNGSEAVVNGDAMDVDRVQDGEEDDDIMEQDQAQSEPEPMNDEESIEMITAATQTDKESKVLTRTLYWTLDKREPTSILHTTWNPQSSKARELLTVGEALCRLYDVPSPEHDGEDITHVAPVDISRDAIISAACWHPRGRYYTCAMEIPQSDSEEHTHTMFDCSAEGAKRIYPAGNNPLEPPGMALAIRYTRSGDLMLTVSTNGKRGLLQIWPTSSAVKHRDPIASQVFDGIVLDAVWTSEESIAVCGKDLLSFYTIEHVPDQTNGVMNGDSAASQEVRNLRQDFSFSTEKQWDRVRFDDCHKVLVASSGSDKELAFFSRKDDTWTTGPTAPEEDGRRENAIAIAFQPLSEDETRESKTPRRLAVARESGDVHVYNLTSTTCELAAKLSIGPHEPALALSWAPSGAKLAVASDEAIKIWDLGASKPVVTWQAAPAKWYQGNEHNLPSDEDVQAEPSLSWDANGQRLAFAVGRKIAIISLLPSPSDTYIADTES